MRKRSLSLLLLLVISGCASYSGPVPGRPAAAQGALVAEESKLAQLQKRIKDQQDLIKLLEEKIALLEADLKKSEGGHP